MVSTRDCGSLSADSNSVPHPMYGAVSLGSADRNKNLAPESDAEWLGVGLQTLLKWVQFPPGSPWRGKHSGECAWL